MPRLFDPADPSPGRHADAATWPARFRAAAEEARALVASLSDAELNTPPAPGSWSVAQCLDHLVRTGAPLLPGLTAAVDRLQHQGRRAAGPYDLGRVGRFFALSQRPDGRPMKTPPLYRPAISAPTGAGGTSGPAAAPVSAAPTPDAPVGAPAAFDTLCHAYADLAARADGFALSSLRVASPALGLLRLNVAAWMETTLLHTQRHLAQAHRAAAAVHAVPSRQSPTA